jgi:hypothetical protein
MKRRFKLNGRRLTILVFTAVIAFLAFRAPAKAWLGKNALPQQQDPSTTQGQVAAATPKPVPTHVESELITIRPSGFEPTQITRPKGNFFLFVENRSGLNSVTLRLDRVAGNRLIDVPVPRERLDWAELLNLTPGDYTVTEANHPNWVCHVTITP